MGRISIIDRRSDPDRVRKRRLGSAKDQEKGRDWDRQRIRKRVGIGIRIGAHQCTYDILILLYLFIRILTTS